MGRRIRRAAMAIKFLIWIAFPLCLTTLCTSERAAAVTFGWVGYQEGTCDKNGKCKLNVPIGGYSTPPGNPNEYGMCGVVALSGDYARATEARIVIVGHSYQGSLQWTGGGVIPPFQFEYTCAHLTEFSGLPPNSKASMYVPPAVTASGGSTKRTQIGNEPDACLWTGISGALPYDQKVTPDVSTEVESGGTKTFAAVTSAGSLSTYAFCYTYAGKTSPWKYSRIGPFTATTPPSAVEPLSGTNQSKFWCLMVGVQGGPLTATPDFNAFLEINPIPHEYAYYVNSNGLYWNCLPFSQ
jgi:hypothetical protein